MAQCVFSRICRSSRFTLCTSRSASGKLSNQVMHISQQPTHRNNQHDHNHKKDREDIQTYSVSMLQCMLVRCNRLLVSRLLFSELTIILNPSQSFLSVCLRPPIGIGFRVSSATSTTVNMMPQTVRESEVEARANGRWTDSQTLTGSCSCRGGTRPPECCTKQRFFVGFSLIGIFCRSLFLFFLPLSFPPSSSFHSLFDFLEVSQEAMASEKPYVPPFPFPSLFPSLSPSPSFLPSS